jgi:hypothetical protein
MRELGAVSYNEVYEQRVAVVGIGEIGAGSYNEVLDQRVTMVEIREEPELK